MKAAERPTTPSIGDVFTLRDAGKAWAHSGKAECSALQASQFYAADIAVSRFRCRIYEKYEEAGTLAGREGSRESSGLEGGIAMQRWVEIEFDCLPLRTIERLDIPLDASPAYRARCERIKALLTKHGAHNTYYLYNARCAYHLANSAEIGLIEYKFDGVAITDVADEHTRRCELDVALSRETCDWLSQPIVEWFAGSVPHSVQVEFDRYIEAGDLQQAKQRLEKLESASDDAGGFLGMYL